ncbi:MAG: EutN/CcmL family microcompartment protein [Pirellulales bacterium]|nr:carbon dioxide concentrating mechanism protein CcmL [Planctomycetales bacterium]
MRIAKVTGTVTLSRSHPLLEGGRYRLAVPLSLDDVAEFAETGEVAPKADTLVMYDDLGAGIGSLVALAESREASHPFLPATKPIDAYNAAILDTIDIGRHANDRKS